MKNYKNLGIITVIILIVLVFAIYKVNALILKQLDQAEVLPPVTVKAPGQVSEEKPVSVIEGTIIEGMPPAVVVQNPLPAPIKSQDHPEAVYENPIDDPVLVQ